MSLFIPVSDQLSRHAARSSDLSHAGKAICHFNWIMGRHGFFYAIQLLKILEPISRADPTLPELTEGSLVPRFKVTTGTYDDSRGHFADVTDFKYATAVLYAMPDIPVDSEYVTPKH